MASKQNPSTPRSILDYAFRVLTVIPRSRQTKIRRQQNINFYLHKYQEHREAYEYMQAQQGETQGDLVARALLLYRDYNEAIQSLPHQGDLHTWTIQDLLLAALEDPEENPEENPEEEKDAQ